jgi:hypothetical protein
VSVGRHGGIGTYTAFEPDEIVALTIPSPPAPNDTATAAPIAAQRTRNIRDTPDMTTSPVRDAEPVVRRDS